MKEVKYFSLRMSETQVSANNSPSKEAITSVTALVQPYNK